MLSSPPALGAWISKNGHEAVHVLDLGLETDSDTIIWEQARKDSAIIITKDEEFVDRWLLSEQPVPIVWLRKGNCSNRSLIQWLEGLWPDAIKRLEQGDQFVEINNS